MVATQDDAAFMWPLITHLSPNHNAGESSLESWTPIEIGLREHDRLAQRALIMHPLRCIRHETHVSDEFFQRTLDSLLAHIAILTEDGTIVAVNSAWNEFARSNQLDHRHWGPGANYLEVCRYATGECAEEAPAMVEGIEAVIGRKQSHFYLEYPCHSPIAQRWFGVRATRFEESGRVFAVVAHENITQRVIAEQRVLEASRLLELQATTDALTGIGNRRSLDERLDCEWKRHERAGRPLSVLLLDVDCFKLFNDTRGHLAGDECLKKIALAVQSGFDRAVDFVARYGGEEFAVILPETAEPGAMKVCERILAAVRGLAIPHAATRARSGVVTVSIGSATTVPTPSSSPFELLHRADTALYDAKRQGRDCAISDTARGFVPAV